jgi:hypothetical protein
MSSENIIPEEFTKVIKDFICDLKNTFPEYVPLIEKWWKNADETEENKSYLTVFDFCKKKLPPRFFDILYQNDSMFDENSEIDTEFFPNIHFKNLWHNDITDKTRETIWKYLQLLLFSVVGTLDTKDAFGDTAKLFEAINQEEFKNKLKETLDQMQGIFDLSGNISEGNGESFGMNDLPDANQINEHITSMLDGKIGKLAREIAEETATNLNMDFENTTDMKDVFNKLLKNPTKLMGLIKTVGDKLDSKIKSGELKESEMIAEATDIMNKMKNMPGMGNIQAMLNKMGMGSLGKMNTSAMESALNQKMKMAKTKERIRAKAEAISKTKFEKEKLDQTNLNMKPVVSEEELMKIFNDGKTFEKTPRGSNPNKKNKKINK